MATHVVRNALRIALDVPLDRIGADAPIQRVLEEGGRGDLMAPTRHWTDIALTLLDRSAGQPEEGLMEFIRDSFALQGLQLQAHHTVRDVVAACSSRIPPLPGPDAAVCYSWNWGRARAAMPRLWGLAVREELDWPVVRCRYYPTTIPGVTQIVLSSLAKFLRVPAGFLRPWDRFTPWCIEMLGDVTPDVDLENAAESGELRGCMGYVLPPDRRDIPHEPRTLGYIVEYYSRSWVDDVEP